MSSLLTSIPQTTAVQPAPRVPASALPAPYRGPMQLHNPRSRHARGSFPFLVVPNFGPRRQQSPAHSNTMKALGGALAPPEVPRMPSTSNPSPTSGPPSIPRKTSPVLLQGRTNAVPLPKFPLRPLLAVAHPHPPFENHHITHVYPLLPTISLLQLSGLVLLSSASSSRATSSPLMSLQLVKDNSTPGGSGSTSRPETSFATLVTSLRLQTAHNLNSIFLPKSGLHLETPGCSSMAIPSFLLRHQRHHLSQTLSASLHPSITPTSCLPTRTQPLHLRHQVVEVFPRLRL